MADWIVSSSALIVIVVLLRFLLKGKISLRLQYALWALVLVRLLVPVSFGQSSFSVMNAVTVKETEYYVWYTGDMGGVQAEPEAGEQAALPDADTAALGVSVGPNTGEVPANTAGILLDRILRSIWIAGIVVTAGIFLFSNLCFAVHLRRSRKRVGCEQTSLSVYVSGAVETPCLFGLFRPAIYVTPDVLADETTLRHVLAHETTHYRHGDHIWALLRCVCLSLHWYNPLVWWVASLSRRDGELACDEDTIRFMRENERFEYGRTLIGLTCAKRSALLTTATTMNGSKRSLKERITLIAKQPKTLVFALVIAVAVCLVAVGCTFTAAEGDVPWTWAKDLSSAEIEEATIWLQDETGYKDYNLAADEIDSLVERLNKLSKFDFKQNTELVGSTPEYGIVLTCGDEWYSMNQCSDSNGTLEMGYGGNMWWISDKKLYTVVSSLLETYSEDGPGRTEVDDKNEKEEQKDGFTALTEEEIAQVNKAFGPLENSDTGHFNPIWCFFTSFYDDPRSLNLKEFLAYFPYREETTAEEFEALKTMEDFPFQSVSALGGMPVPIHKLSAQTVNEVLQRYMGVSLSELEDAGKSSSRLLYLEEFDAYYNFTSDAGGSPLSIVRGEKQGDEVILYSDNAVLTLRKSGGNYFIQSFQPN